MIINIITFIVRSTLGSIYLPPKTTSSTTTTTPKPIYLPPYTYLPPSQPPITYLPVRKPPPSYPPPFHGPISTIKTSTTKYNPFTSPAPPPTTPKPTSKIPPELVGYKYLPPKESARLEIPQSKIQNTNDLRIIIQ